VGTASCRENIEAESLSHMQLLKNSGWDILIIDVLSLLNPQAETLSTWIATNTYYLLS